VRENMHPSHSFFPFYLVIHSLRTSNLEYFVHVSVTNSTATISPGAELTGDASFGIRNLSSSILFAEYDLNPGQQEIMTSMNIRGIPITIINDFYVEDNETITLRVSPSTVGGDTRNFECYDDDEDPVEGNYFCFHTITIVDEDGQFHCVCAV